MTLKHPSDGMRPMPNPSRSDGRGEPHGSNEPRESEYVAALLSVGAVADRDMVCRTQRRVREQAIEMAERRLRARNAVGLAILGFSLLLLLLTPIVWSSFHLAAGWDVKDFETVLLCTLGWLFPVTVIGLVLGRPHMRGNRGTRRIDHRLESKLGSIVR